MELTGGEALARALVPHGVPFVFGIAGGKLGPFMQAIGTEPSIRYVGTRHEATAAHMAAAIHAGSGAMCVAMAEAGPGGAYLAAGTAHAFNNNLALLAITSNNQHAASYPNRGMFMEQDNAAAFSHVTKWNAAVHDGARIPELVREAFRHALTGRPGPVHLDVPQDVLARRYRYSEADFASPGPRGRPRGDATLVEALREADVVFAIGCRFSSWMWDNEGALVRPPQHLIQADIDPAMLGRVTHNDIGIAGDAQAVLEDVLAAIGNAAQPPGRAAWRALCAERRARDRAVLAALADDTAMPMHPAALARAAASSIPEDALVCYDGGHTSFWSNDFCSARAPATRFHDPGLAQLGFGLPYAIALKLHAPDRTVVNITGDGAFGFTLPELDTARRYGAAVITVIHNNAAWGVIARSQSMQKFALGCDLAGTDYAAIARGFGCHGETVRTPAEFPAAFARATASGLPAVLDCLTRFESHPAMPHFGRMGSYRMTDH
jgi:thiamine pyrophosphate-dependent acetolactate synthase large subunit-like protein